MRSSAATGWRAWKLGPVGARWNSGRGRLGTPPPSAIRWCRPSAPSAFSAAAARCFEDRLHLPLPPQARQVEVHADHAQRPVVDQQFGDHRAARLERRQLQRRAVDHADVLLHQDRIAVPADVARVDLEQPVGVLAAGSLSSTRLWRTPRSPACTCRGRRSARAEPPSPPAEALVGLLQRDDVGIDLLQHLEHALRVALPSVPTALRIL